MKKLLSAILSNPIALIGAIIASTNIGMITFLTLLMMFVERPGPYSDIVVYFLLPLIALAGLVLMVFGLMGERRRRRRGLPERRLLVLDFNDPKQRAKVIFGSCAFAVLTLLYAFAGYKTYEYSESTQFCGLTCHGVMKPEYTAHQYSYHAEVTCAECHVGSGAKYFVEAKMNGTRMLLGMFTGHYARPVPAPVKNLRPSQDTCETCHGPRYQFSERLESHTFYLADETNTPWTVGMILRMGGEQDVSLERPPRMHWHYTTTREIVYAAADPKRQDIPWVTVTRRDGTSRTYRRTNTKLSDTELAALPRRTMDCIDCHNRVGHYSRPPDWSVNALMNFKLIDPALPEVKKISLDAMGATYAGPEQAREGIRSKIETFYREKHPATFAEMRPRIEQAILAVQGTYGRNFDPVMKANWQAYPNNAGHMYTAGCFRCHDGKHVTEDGKVLSQDCNLCHALVKRETGPDKRSATLTPMDYPHPVDIGNDYKNGACADCHGLP